MENNKHRVVFGEKVIYSADDALLSDVIGAEKPCGGRAFCGKCKVKAEGKLSVPSSRERELLSEEELQLGLRLACLTRILGDCTVETLKSGQGSVIISGGILPNVLLSPTFLKYGVAIDIGTTTLAARLLDTKANILAEAVALNPEISVGADVLTRIQASMSGQKDNIAKLIRHGIDELILKLAIDAKISPEDIDRVVATGNTVMLSLLLAEDVEPFSHAPFSPKRLFGEELSAEQVGLSSLRADALVYLPPCASAFVGADVLCSAIGAELFEKESALLADIGTNGEMLLWNKGQLYACSTAAGPAFEGVGITHGMRAENGAVSKAYPLNGKIHTEVIGQTAPTGICASGLVDLAACMLDFEIIDESGFLEDGVFSINDTVCVTQKDIRMLQNAKSAISAGILSLMGNIGLSPYDINDFYIAGGFGTYLNSASAVKIGLFPRALANKAKPIGNAALTGASLLLLSKNATQKCIEVAKKCLVLDLSSNENFSLKYIEGMLFCECEP